MYRIILDILLPLNLIKYKKSLLKEYYLNNDNIIWKKFNLIKVIFKALVL
jgi:hypothetical protein